MPEREGSQGGWGKRFGMEEWAGPQLGDLSTATLKELKCLNEGPWPSKTVPCPLPTLPWPCKGPLSCSSFRAAPTVLAPDNGPGGENEPIMYLNGGSTSGQGVLSELN